MVQYPNILYSYLISHISYLTRGKTVTETMLPLQQPAYNNRAEETPLSAELAAKYADLQTILRDMGTCVIGYSGGVDSTLVLKVAHDVLGDRAVAVTGDWKRFRRAKWMRRLKWRRRWA